MADRSPGAQRVEMPPPSVGTGDAYGWFTRLALALNNLPPVSFTSYGNPNSSVTGAIGDRLINLSSATSVYWVKQAGSSNTGWVPLA